MYRQLDIKMAAVLEENFHDENCIEDEEDENKELKEDHEDVFEAIKSSSKLPLKLSYSNESRRLSLDSTASDRRDSIVELQTSEEGALSRQVVAAFEGNHGQNVFMGNQTLLQKLDTSNNTYRENKINSKQCATIYPQNSYSPKQIFGSSAHVNRQNSSSKLTSKTVSPSNADQRKPTSNFCSSTASRKEVTTDKAKIRKKLSLTITMKDKFVSELAMFDPSSKVKDKTFCLGIFVSTSRHFGDHSIYKVSPLSPFKALKLSPQDRILRLNGLSITHWSHQTLLYFVKSIALKPSTSYIFEIDYLPSCGFVNSVAEAPRIVRKRVTFVVKNGRMTGEAISVITPRYSHRDTTECVVTSVQDFEPYLKVVSSNSNHVCNGQLQLTLGERPNISVVGESSYLKVHTFEETPTTEGQVVVFETFCNHSFLQATGGEGDELSIMVADDNEQISNVTAVDSRFFKLFTQNESKKIQHMQTGLYVKVLRSTSDSPDRLVLSSYNDNTFPDSMLFEKYFW